MKPPKLRKGDTVGIASPSRWLAKEAFKDTLRMFEKAGYAVRTGPAAFLRDNHYAGTTQERVSELESMFSDDDVKAIICSRGGYGAIRVSDFLNYDIVLNHPKIFVGYSDITALHASILRKTGLTTFHGPMLITFFDKKSGRVEEDEFSWKYLLDVLSGKAPIQMDFPDDLRPSILRSGYAEGELFGGNLTLLTNMVATPWDFDPTGKILFVEDLDEKLYRIDRLLLHLKRSGKLESVAGLIVGEMVGVDDEEIPFGKTVEEIVLDVCQGTDFPIVSNFPCGHGVHQMTMPISVTAQLDCTTDPPTFTLPEPAVI